MVPLPEQSVLAVIRASRPSFRNAHDKVTFVVHASFLATGYVLNATGPTAFNDDALTSTSSDEVGIEQWNEFEDSYAFVYSKPEKGSKVLVKCLAMNDKLLVDALSEGSSDPVHLEINVGNYDGGNGGTNYSLQFKDLGKLVSIVDKEIVKKLGGSSTASSSTKSSSSLTREQRDNANQPSVGDAEPQGPQPFHPLGVVFPPVYPIVGGSDLFPGPGAGMYPTRGDFGGMLVGPNDPRFFGGIGGEPGFLGGRPGVPPGARFDPYGPSGVPGFDPNPRIPRRPGGGTHPDLEHFRDGNDFI
ncbi:unnamed protein product [Ilex paraguariensis]|uniref:Proteasome inhibitor PI31 subunit n=1 Tax=Ilex paraguariensis TaxID=185542 RepID=A0ABC8QXY2_9AQUA